MEANADWLKDIFESNLTTDSGDIGFKINSMIVVDSGERWLGWVFENWKGVA